MWFKDECRFQQHGSQCTMWVPPEEVDSILSMHSLERGSGIFGTVCVSDGRLMTSPKEKFNAETFLSFLRQLLHHRRRNRKMNCRPGQRPLASHGIDPALVDKKSAGIPACFLPPYSPELNAMEWVWKINRRLCTHNRYFPALD